MSHASKPNQPKTKHDWHLWHVFSDPEFNKELDAIEQLEKESGGTSKEILAMRYELATFYRISIEELGRYQVGRVIYLDHNERTTSLDIDRESTTGTITFDLLTTSKAEIEEQFKVVEGLRKMGKITPPRRRPSEHPDLVYAVFKARQQNLTFREIYERYSSGELDDYSGSATQFKNEESLERYYRKYQP